MARIVVDPVTRIEGHLRIEAQVEGGSVTDAWSSGTMFRGIELILRGRDPREAWIWTQRICGVCTTVHALTSVRAVEDALGIEVPPNAELIRNIIGATQYVQDHVIHFYHLHALDWVDVTLALKADPAKTSQLAESISSWPKSSRAYFKAIQDRVKVLVESKQLSLFSSGYWGHPAYHLPPEANLLAVAHYIEALEFQREFIRIHAVLGGKNPHLQTYLVGGMACAMDPNEPHAPINPERITFLSEIAKTAQTFVEQVYIPDVLAVAGFYRDWFGRGEGLGNFLSYGEYPQRRNPRHFQVFLATRSDSRARFVQSAFRRPAQVSEYVTHSWYEYTEGDSAGKIRMKEKPVPNIRGPSRLSNSSMWKAILLAKSPRFRTMPMEVGPLSRMLVAYASGHAEVKELVTAVLTKLNAPATALFSTLGRIAARAIETQLMARQVPKWIDQLYQILPTVTFASTTAKSGTRNLAEICAGMGFPRSAAGRSGPLGSNRRSRYQELPMRGSDNVERRSARRERAEGRL